MTTEQYGRQAKGFAFVPSEILDAAPGYHVMAVWCVIWRYAEGSDEGCSETLTDIAKVARVGQHRTRDAIRWLKENGWLIAEERSGYTTRYFPSLEGGQ